MDEQNLSFNKKTHPESDGTDDDEDERFDDIKCQEVDVDDVWHFLGRFGKYQVKQNVMLSFVAICLGPSILSGMFAGKNVDFECAKYNITGSIFHNSSIVASSCYIQLVDNGTSEVLKEESCPKYEYEGGSNEMSYISEWDLVCDHETLGQLPQVMTMVGMLLGALFLPSLGDRYGRKKLMIGACLGIHIVSIVSAFVEQFGFYVFLKFLGGAFQQGCLVPLFTLHLECLPLDVGTIILVFVGVEWVTSLSMMGLVSYFCRDYSWRTFMLALSLMTTPCLICSCFVDESLRWLLRNSKKKEAKAILQKACRLNKKDFNKLLNTVLNVKTDDTSLLTAEKITKDVAETTSRSEQKSQLKVILQNRNMRKITFISCYAWMISSLVYYGLLLMSTSLAGDFYVNYFLNFVIELPASIMAYFFLHRFGRKRTLMYSKLVSSIALFLTVIVACFIPPGTTNTILQTILTLLGKFFISAVFNGVWLYTTELYPTNFRALGIGLSSTFARVGSSFSPLFTILARKAFWAPGILFSSGCLISAFLMNLLPETRWRELPKDIEEIDQWIEIDKNEKERNSRETTA